MTAADVAAQLVAGLASAATLFLGASGLTLIFGVTRVVNFAHGAFVMVGAYVAADLAQRSDHPTAFWWAALAATAVGALAGVLLQTAVVRPLRHRPALVVLLATFAVTLIVRDAVRIVWGPEDRLGPLPAGFDDAWTLGDTAIPAYDLLLLAVAPLAWLALEALLARTRFGLRVRAAAVDGEMLAALGVRPQPLFIATVALGGALAGLAGALAAPREGATLAMDLGAVTDAFVVVVLGGLGSVRGAFAAALLIGVVKAACALLGPVELPGGVAFDASRLVLAIEFALMAAVLVWRPGGFAGRVPDVAVHDALERAPLPPPAPRAAFAAAGVAIGAAFAIAVAGDDWSAVLATEIAIATLIAASLHLLLGPGGMAPFGHAALSGLGAYAAALTLLHLDVAWPLALVAGAVAGAAAGRLAGIACARAGGVMLAMLTLAFAQVVWSIAIQWDSVTGGSNGLVGTAPTGVFGTPRGFVGVAVVTAAFGTLLLAGVVRSRFGAQLRAARDAPTRAAASGIDVARVQARAFAIAGAAAGLAGALQALAKGSLSPDNLAIARSVDALAMVLLGGVASPAGPVLGATAFTLLQDFALREIVHWQLALGIVILALALALPRGLSGLVERVGAARTDRPHST